MTNEVLVSYSRLTLDNHFKDPGLLAQGAGGDHVQRHLPGWFDEPVPADRLAARLGRQRPGRQPVGEGQRHVRAQRRAAVQQQADEAGWRARPEVRHLDRARPEAAELPEPRSRSAVVRHRQRPPGPAIPARTCWSAAIGQFNQGTARTGNPAPGAAVRRVPLLEHRRLRAGQLEAALEPDARIRRPLRLLDQQRGDCIGLGGYFTPDLYDSTKGSFLDPGTFQRVNGVCYVETGCAPAGILENRSPFALPRVNVAWDIDGEGNNVAARRLRPVLQPQHGQRRVRQHAAAGAERLSGRRQTSGLAAATATASGLTYDTVSEATLANRIGSIGINSLTPDSFTFPKTHSFSLSYARRIPWNQVRRGQLRRHSRPRPGQPQQRQRHAVRRAELRHLQRRRSVGAGQPRGGGERRQQPGVVPPVQRAQRPHAVRLPRASRTTTRCRSR